MFLKHAKLYKQLLKAFLNAKTEALMHLMIQCQISTVLYQVAHLGILKVSPISLEVTFCLEVHCQ
jgi:hypothetical protein